jgi:HD-GYP domain-containing protein (c-di-GMP phosphodiesterase class II)
MLKESAAVPEEAATIVLQHHERDDGTGYPYGLNGEDIHPYARICRLADVYEALTSERPYHKRHSTFQALKIMRDRVMADADQEMLRHFIGLFAG